MLVDQHATRTVHRAMRSVRHTTTPCTACNLQGLLHVLVDHAGFVRLDFVHDHPLDRHAVRVAKRLHRCERALSAHRCFRMNVAYNRSGGNVLYNYQILTLI